VNDAMVDLLVKLERCSVEEADAFVVVTVDEETGIVLHATGPFAEPEAALVQAGIDEAAWNRATGPEDGRLLYRVVSLWEPSL
jgi:hypothetical protein